jgi:transposase InsO family protein
MAAADTGFTPSEKAGIKKLFSSLGFSVNAAIASGDQHTEVDDDWFADAKVAILVADGETDNNQDCPGLCDDDSLADDFDAVQGKSESDEDEPPGLCDESSSEDGADFACEVDADSDEENPPGLCDDVSSDDDDDVPQVVQRKFDLDHDAIKLSKGMQQHFSMYTTAQDLARMLWLVDSGASRNFCKSREHFISLDLSARPLKVGTSDSEGQGFVTQGKGTVRVFVTTRKGKVIPMDFEAWYAPHVSMNIISYYTARWAGINVHLDDRPWLQYGKDKANLVFDGKKSLDRGVLPFLQCVEDPATLAQASVTGMIPPPVVLPPVATVLPVNLPVVSPVLSGDAEVNALRVKHTARSVAGHVRKQTAEARAVQKLRPLSLEELHYVKGHRAMEGLLKESRAGIHSGIRLTTTEPTPCAVCRKTKFDMPPSQKRAFHRAEEPGERWEGDLKGPMRVRGYGGVFYILFLLCSCSRHVLVDFLAKKSDAAQRMLEMLDFESKHHGHHWRMLFTDGGGEFVNGLTEAYCARAGVSHKHSAPYVHDHNGGAERVIRTVVNIARAMMAACDVPPSCWPFAVRYAVVIYNSSSHSALPVGVVPAVAYGLQATPHERLQLFGCRAEIKVMKPRAVETMDPDQAVSAWFVGLSDELPGYLFLTPDFTVVHASIARFAPLSELRARTGRFAAVDWWDEMSESEEREAAGMPASGVAAREEGASPAASPPVLPELPADEYTAERVADLLAELDASPPAITRDLGVAGGGGVSWLGRLERRAIARAADPDAGGEGVEEGKEGVEPAQPRVGPVLRSHTVAARAPPEAASLAPRRELAGRPAAPKQAVGDVGTEGGEQERPGMHSDGVLRARPSVRAPAGLDELPPHPSAVAQSPGPAALPGGVEVRAPATMTSPGASVGVPAAPEPPPTGGERRSARQSAPRQAFNISSTAGQSYRANVAAAEVGRAMADGEPSGLDAGRAGQGPGVPGTEGTVSIAVLRAGQWAWRSVQPDGPMVNGVYTRLAMTTVDVPDLTPLDSQLPDSIMLGAPRSRKQMLLRPDRQKFLDAEGKEFGGLEEMGTWEEAIVAVGTKLLGNMMVYTIKPDGRYKARFVVMGNQVGDDVEQPESSSPTASRTSVFLLLCLALELGWPVYGFDVTQAYLYGTIPEQYRFYMRVPPGYKTRMQAPPGFMVALWLRRALYGMRFSGRLWNERIHKALLEQGFVSLGGDPCVYVCLRRSLVIVLFVDDLLLTGEKQTDIDCVRRGLKRQFKMTDQGEVTEFLGMEIARTATTITVTQRRYITEKLEEFKQYLPRGAPLVPWVITRCTDKTECPEPGSERAREMSKLPYRSLTGSLMYAAVVTRPETLKVVTDLSRFNSNPGIAHWRAALHVLAYLGGSREKGLRFTASGTRSRAALRLRAFVDASFAPEAESVADPRSCGGTLVQLLGGPVMVSCDRHGRTTLSTMESEYAQLSNGVRNIEWVRSLAAGMGFPQEGPTPTYEDNEQVFLGVVRAVPSARTRYVVVRYAHVREAVADRILEVIQIGTAEQLADLLTKLLGREVFVRLREWVLGYTELVPTPVSSAAHRIAEQGK